jgi:hypothetical protein
MIDQYDEEYYGLREMVDPKIVNQPRNIGLRKFENVHSCLKL